MLDSVRSRCERISWLKKSSSEQKQKKRKKCHFSYSWFLVVSCGYKSKLPDRWMLFFILSRADESELYQRYYVVRILFLCSGELYQFVFYERNEVVGGGGNKEKEEGKTKSCREEIFFTNNLKAATMTRIFDINMKLETRIFFDQTSHHASKNALTRWKYLFT